MNGKRFHTKDREQHRRTQNCGVFVTGEHQSNSVEFYGVINDVVELHYMGWRRVYLFKCQWFDVGDRRRGIRVDNHMISVNIDRTWYKEEPFVLACQASQCFYLKDPRVKGNWYVVQKFIDRNMYDLPPGPLSKDHDSEPNSGDAYQEDESANVYTTVESTDVGVATPLNRSDIEPSPIDDLAIIGDINHDDLARDFINDEDATDSEEDRDGSDEDSDDKDSDDDDEDSG